MRALLALMLVLALPGAAEAQGPTVIWEGEDGGGARQISIAATDRHVFLSEAYAITTIDVATGVAAFTRIDGYLPVAGSLVEGDTLYLAMGYVESGTPPAIASFRAGDAAITTLATLTVSPRALTVSGGEPFFTDEAHVYRVHGGRASIIAALPRGGTIHGDIAADATHVYFLVLDATPSIARTLMRVPRTGGTIERLASVPGADTVVRRDVAGAGGRRRTVVTSDLYRAATVRSYDIDSHALTELVTGDPVARLSVRGDELTWASGNFYMGHDVALRRLGGTAVVDLFAGDRRLVEGLTENARGYYLLLGAHPDGECEMLSEGCSRHPMPSVERCSLPDHRLFFIPR